MFIYCMFLYDTFHFRVSCFRSDPHPDLPSTSDLVIVADYAHRRSDWLASYRGLKRRRLATSAIRQRDIRAGLTTAREPTTREIRTEVFQQVISELEGKDSRSVALAQLLSSMPVTQGISKKKSRARVRVDFIERIVISEDCNSPLACHVLGCLLIVSY